MTSADPPVAVLLPTLNGEAFIGDQIDALVAQRTDVAWHLVVIDGGSADRTLDVVRERTRDRMQTRIVELKGAPGVNAGLNAGVRSTYSELLLIAEHDDVVGDGWIDSIAQALDEHWLVGSHLERFQLNAPAAAGSRRVFPEDAATAFPHVRTTGMGLRRSLWELLDGFDESYRYGGNDIEFCARAYLAGHPAFLAPNAVVHYRVRGDASGAFKQARTYGITTVRLHRQFGRELMPRRPVRSVARDWARNMAWTARGVTQPEYRLRAAFRVGLLIGYLQGSVQYRRLYL